MIPSPSLSPPSMRLHPRSAYLAILVTALQQSVAYRGTTLLNFLTSLVWVGMLYALWQTIFAARTEIAGLSWTEMRTYLVVAYAINGVSSYRAIGRITRPLRTGQIAIDLIRPMDYLVLQLLQAIGMTLIEGFGGGALLLGLSVPLLGIAVPSSLLHAVAFLVSVVLGFLISFLLSFVTALICFRTLNSLGIVWMYTAIVNLLSGALIPLQFFPGVLQTLARATPFSGIIYTPTAIYLGKLHGTGLLQALAFQLVWVALLWGLARLMWTWSAGALEIQGG